MSLQLSPESLNDHGVSLQSTDKEQSAILMQIPRDFFTNM